MGIRAIVALAYPPSGEPHHQLHHHHLLHSQHQHLFRPTKFIIIIGVSVALVILLLVAVIFFFTFRRHKSSKSNRSTASTVNQKYGGFSHKNICSNASPDMANCLYMGIVGPPSLSKFRGGQVFTYKELEVATDSFNPENVIGNGGFGVVYRGILSDGTVAAIKMLNREGKQGEREFRVEVDLLSRLHSPYLVQLLGYCADQHHRLLVFEFMPNGSLQNHLHPSSNKKYQLLNWGTRLRIALDCARGLEFLHEHSNQPVIHRDFKCSNILLDRNFRAKVSDFGLAKMGSDKINGQVTTRVMGTTGYVAPEYASSGKVTTKSDVYCYGVVLLELITGRVPVDSRRMPGEQVLVSWALPRLTNREKVMEMVDPVLEGQYSKKDLIQVAAIAAVCVQSEADYRPFMTDVVQSLIPLVKNLSTSVPSTPYKSQHRKVPSMS
ncbi:probable serine/threonine-protein kinase PBL7 [Aristolochia californica]|uniref:probable serine/threonine-protein kinase PBL7 n=1 Tax=Aristolochia californica TaxID=171875 RepID=UPI0035E27184